MATTLIMGQPGAGKTSLAMERIMLPHFASDPKKFDPDSTELGNGIIATNVPINRERWVEEFGEEAMSRLITFPEFIVDSEGGERRPFTLWEDFEPLLELRDEHGRAPLFVIDEAHEVMPKGMRFSVDKTTGQRVDSFPNKLLLLFTRQRHYLLSFALVTQDPFSMAPDILKQVHSTLYVENAAMKGAKLSYTLKIWNKAPPRNFATVTFESCDDAQRKPKSYNSETQSFFISNSKNKMGSAGRALEGRYQHSRSIWRRPIVMIGMPLAIAMVGWGVTKLYGGLSGQKSAQVVPSAPKATTKVSQAPAAPEFEQKDVIEDLSKVEQKLGVDEGRKSEAAYPTRLYASYGVLESRTGPIVATQYPWANSPTYAHLSDYAAFWGYSIEAAECGWTLTRNDNVRHLYDTQCLGVRHVASVASTSAPTEDAAQKLERLIPGAAAVSPVAGANSAKNGV